MDRKDLRYSSRKVLGSSEALGGSLEPKGGGSVRIRGERLIFVEELKNMIPINNDQHTVEFL